MTYKNLFNSRNNPEIVNGQEYYIAREDGRVIRLINNSASYHQFLSNNQAIFLTREEAEETVPNNISHFGDYVDVDCLRWQKKSHDQLKEEVSHQLEKYRRLHQEHDKLKEQLSLLSERFNRLYKENETLEEHIAELGDYIPISFMELTVADNNIDIIDITCKYIDFITNKKDNK